MIGKQRTDRDPRLIIDRNRPAHAGLVRSARSEQRICKIYDSPCLPESEAIFQIATGGIMDAKD